MPRRALTTATLCALALATGACGGGGDSKDDDGANAAQAQAQEQAQQHAQAPASVPGGSLALPDRVPRKESGPGDPGAIKIIRLWSEALQRSDVKRAAAYWAIPARVQNGTPVVTLASLDDVRLFNASLPCGGQLVSALGAPRGFIVAVFKLRHRPGASCGSGAGNDARTAILVRGGKIAEWYRLPDDPDARQPTPQPQPQHKPQPGAPPPPAAPEDDNEHETAPATPEAPPLAPI